MLLSCLAVVIAGAAPSAPRRLHAAELEVAVDTVTALAAVALFAMSRARWRLVGEVTSLWTGTGALVAGLAGVGAPRVVGPLILDRPPVEDSSLAFAGLCVGLVLLAVGAFAPAVDTRVRPLRLAAAAGAATVLLALPGFTSRPVAIGVGVAAAVLRSWREALGWAAVLGFTLVWGLFGAGFATEVGYAVGFTAAAACCALELGRAYSDQRSRLFRSELTLETAAVGERLQAASRSTRRHDVRNAVVAVEGAALVLESHVDRLSPEDRSALTKVLSSGVERLQRLLGDDAGGGVATVDLAQLAAQVAAERGISITVDVPTGLVASGSALHSAEVLRILLDNAQRRAPGQPVTVAGRREGDWMVLQVRDRGAPVGREERRSVGSADMGFLVATRLMRDQGGDVWVESHPEGGAFSLCLPCASCS